MKRFPFLLGLLWFTLPVLVMAQSTWNDVEFTVGQIGGTSANKWIQLTYPIIEGDWPTGVISPPTIQDAAQIYRVEINGRPHYDFINSAGLLIGGKYILSAPQGSSKLKWYRIDRVEPPSYVVSPPLSLVLGSGGTPIGVANSTAPTPLSFFGLSLATKYDYYFRQVPAAPSLAIETPVPLDANGPIGLIQTVWRATGHGGTVLPGEDTFVALSSVNASGGYSDYEIAINQASFQQNRIYYDSDWANFGKPRWDGTPGTFLTRWHPRYIFAMQLEATPQPGHGDIITDGAVSVYVGPANDPLHGTLNVDPMEINLSTASNKTVRLFGDAYDNLSKGTLPEIRLEIRDSSNKLMSATNDIVPVSSIPPFPITDTVDVDLENHSWNQPLDVASWPAGEYTVVGKIYNPVYGVESPLVNSPQRFRLTKDPCTAQNVKVVSDVSTQTPAGANTAISLTVDSGTSVEFTASGAGSKVYTWTGPTGTVWTQSNVATSNKKYTFTNPSTTADIIQTVKVSSPAGIVGGTDYCASTEAVATVTVKRSAGGSGTTVTVKARAVPKPEYRIWFDESDEVETSIRMNP